jgi:hypothetical protein
MKTYGIKFKNRGVFEEYITIANEVSDKPPCDIGYADKVILFDNEEDKDTVICCMLVLHIRMDEFEEFEANDNFKWG